MLYGLLNNKDLSGVKFYLSSSSFRVHTYFPIRTAPVRYGTLSLKTVCDPLEPDNYVNGETFLLNQKCFFDKFDSIDAVCDGLAKYFDQLYANCKPRQYGKDRSELLTHKCANINRIRQNIVSR